MKSLADLIINHPVPGVREAGERALCAETIQRILGVKISPAKVSYEDECVSLSAPPIVKSAALARFEEIRAALAGQDIRMRELR